VVDVNDVTGGVVVRCAAYGRWRHGSGTYLQGISTEEVIGAVHGRKAPMTHASAGLRI